MLLPNNISERNISRIDFSNKEKNILFQNSFLFQILRSSCEWSAGIKTIECSIHEAYIDLILKAKHFIYIEVTIMALCILW